mmetsp:Transcript_131379/g.262148  ORF Transcript_131379/g.262148 Transcript_131379/m.262148 type:complete len:80 (-) Transcript_131379:424-663(-)
MCCRLINLAFCSQEVDLRKKGKGLQPHGKHPAEVRKVVSVPGAVGVERQNKGNGYHCPQHAPPVRSLSHVMEASYGVQL